MIVVFFWTAFLFQRKSKDENYVFRFNLVTTVLCTILLGAVYLNAIIYVPTPPNLWFWTRLLGLMKFFFVVAEVASFLVTRYFSWHIQETYLYLLKIPLQLGKTTDDYAWNQQYHRGFGRSVKKGVEGGHFIPISEPHPTRFLVQAP